MKLYLCGPMTGLANHNFPEFHFQAQRLRDLGHIVTCPAENPLYQDLPLDDPEHGSPNAYRYYLQTDLQLMMEAECEALALLRGWSRSKGCAVEIAFARACDMPLLDAYTMSPLTILHEALEVVGEGRQANYGHPKKDFARAVALWNVIWADKLKEPLDEYDYAAGLRMVKEARLMHQPNHRDSLVDICGYARTAERLDEPV